MRDPNSTPTVCVELFLYLGGGGEARKHIGERRKPVNSLALDKSMQ